MAWFVLIVSGMLEAVWATALGYADGFRKLIPSLVFFVALALSMVGLAYSVRTISPAIAYVVWVGIGACLTVIYAFLAGTENATPIKVALIIVIIAAIAGLKLVSPEA